MDPTRPAPPPVAEITDLPAQRVMEVADGIVAVLQEPGTLGLSNCVAIAGESTSDRGGVLLDAMLLPEMATKARAALAARGIHIDTVVHTHHHLDHIGGNEAFADARCVALPAVVADIDQMLANITIFDWLIPRYAGRFATLTVRRPEPVGLAELAIPRGGRPMLFGPAHSGADLAVWFPDSRVLLAGDLCMNGVTPLAIHGSQAGWIDAIDALIALRPLTVFCGHGPLATVEQLHALRDYLSRVVTAGKAAAAAGHSPDDVLPDFDPGPLASWLEPTRTRQNLLRAIAEAG
jgi:cyclase